jgi:hypothetical protein
MKALLLLALAASSGWSSAPAPVPGARADTVRRLADEATWKRLLARAQKNPTRTQLITSGGTTYKVFIVSAREAVKGQNCPAGSQAENTFFLSKPVSGTGGEVYPVRISAACRGDEGVRDSFSADADLDGTLIDAALYNRALGVVVHPTSERLSPDTELSSLNAFLSRLVALFLKTAP